MALKILELTKESELKLMQGYCGDGVLFTRLNDTEMDVTEISLGKDGKFYLRGIKTDLTQYLELLATQVEPSALFSVLGVLTGVAAPLAALVKASATKGS